MGMAQTITEAVDLIRVDREAGCSTDDILTRVAHYLHDRLAGYDWVGFYVARPSLRRLELGPYAGAPTDHVAIPYGRGICGQVALVPETYVVPDVAAQDNYLSCSLHVRSEIVVPIMVNGAFRAQLDVDSHTLNRFGPADRELLETLAGELAPLFA
jgi:L-methionine (R)-S-oxide reductase